MLWHTQRLEKEMVLNSILAELLIGLTLSMAVTGIVYLVISRAQRREKKPRFASGGYTGKISTDEYNKNLAKMLHPQPELTINGQRFLAVAQSVALKAADVPDQRSKQCAAYLLTAIDYIGGRGATMSISSHVLVSREDLEKWRAAWLCNEIPTGSYGVAGNEQSPYAPYLNP